MFLPCIRPITGYACPVFYEGLRAHLSYELERIQKRTLRTIFPFRSYIEALIESGIIKLSDRRQEVVVKLFNPLSPSIKLQILLLCFHTFLTEAVGRSC